MYASPQPSMYVLCFDHISAGVSVVSEVSECRVAESLNVSLTLLKPLDTTNGSPLSEQLDTGLTLVSECRAECRLTLA